MKKILLGIAAIICCVVLESVIFIRFIPWDLMPDSIICVIASVALVTGGVNAGLYGAAAGLVMGILFSPVVGVEALTYFVTALLLGVFTRKYFADNWIFAGAAAFAAHPFKEVVTASFAALLGSEVAFFAVFLRRLLPSAVLTGLMTIPVFLVYRHLQQDRLRRARYE